MVIRMLQVQNVCEKSQGDLLESVKGMNYMMIIGRAPQDFPVLELEFQMAPIPLNAAIHSFIFTLLKYFIPHLPLWLQVSYKSQFKTIEN